MVYSRRSARTYSFVFYGDSFCVGFYLSVPLLSICILPFFSLVAFTPRGVKASDIVMSLSAVVVAFRAARRCVVSLRATTTMVFENAARSTTLMVSSSRAASNSYASCSNALLTKSDGVTRSRLASWVERCAPRRSFAASAAAAPAAPAPAALRITTYYLVCVEEVLCSTQPFAGRKRRRVTIITSVVTLNLSRK